VDERIDVIDDRGRPTGEVVYKSEAHRRGLPHRCFHCWVWGTDGSGEPYLLVQRRAVTKETWPGRLDVTAAGHLQSGEEPLEGGLRELEEEIGLRVEPHRLVPLSTRWVDLEIPQGRDREFHHVFLLFERTSPEALQLQREEVEALLRLSIEDAEVLDVDGSAPAVEYAGGALPAPTRVRFSDFVPNGNDYLARVAGAVGRARAGEDPGRAF
jgi:isopentenyldiphosphate isomerase